MSGLLSFCLLLWWAPRAPYGDADLQPRGQRRFNAQNRREDGFAANHLELFAVKRGLVGATGAAMLGGINIEEARDHLVVIERRQQHGRSFARAHDKLSRTVRHRLPVRECAARRNRKGFSCALKKAPRHCCPGLRLSSSLLRVLSERDPRPVDPRRARRRLWPAAPAYRTCPARYRGPV